QPEPVAQDLSGARGAPTGVDGRDGDDTVVLEDVDVPADMPSLEEVGDRGKRVEEERVLPNCLFQVRSSSTEEEHALERTLKEDREDMIAVAVAAERLKAYLDRADGRSAMICEALDGRREIARLRARLYSVVNEAKDAVAQKEREMDQTAKLNQELTQSLAALTQESARKEKELQEANQKQLEDHQRREVELQAALAEAQKGLAELAELKEAARVNADSLVPEDPLQPMSLAERLRAGPVRARALMTESGVTGIKEVLGTLKTHFPDTEFERAVEGMAADFPETDMDALVAGFDSLALRIAAELNL
ncbi:unnamed protein product, partial [Urochloa humidicola]